MIVLWTILIWIGLGIIGIILDEYVTYRKAMDDNRIYNLTNEDVLYAIILTLTGPMAFLFGVSCFIKYKNATDWVSWRTRPIFVRYPPKSTMTGSF